MCSDVDNFDRFAAILSITNNLKIWRRNYHVIFVILLLLTLFMNFSTRKAMHFVISLKLPIDGMLIFDNSTNAYYVHYDRTANYNSVFSFIVELVFGFITCLICSAYNIFSLRRLLILRRRHSISNAEVSFFLISFFIFLAQVLNLAIVVFYIIAVVFEQPWIYLISDITSLRTSISCCFLVRSGDVSPRNLESSLRNSICLLEVLKMQPIVVFQLVYGIPGVLTYFVVIYAMRKMRSVLNSSFIAIFTITAAIVRFNLKQFNGIISQNIATWINSWISLRLSFEPFFNFFNEWTLRNEAIRLYFRNFLVFLVSLFYYAQNICALLLVLDRFAAIHATATNIRWWNNSYAFVTACGLGLSLIVNLASRYSINGYLLFRSDDVFQGFADKSPLLAVIVQLVFGTIVFLICCVLNVNTIADKTLPYSTHNKHFKSEQEYQDEIKSSAQEFSFFLISFCIFIAQVFLYTIILAAPLPVNPSIRSLRTFTFTILFFASDMFSIGPAFYTLLLPGPIRRFFVDKIRRTRNGRKITAMQVVKIIQLVYGIPGIFAYFAVIYAMHSLRKTLSSSFISIFIVTTVINIFTWLNSWICLRLLSEKFFKHVLETLVPQLYFAQNICVLLLTYNRFSSIYNAVKNTRFVPMEGEKWWKSTYFVVFTSLIFCLFVNVASSPWIYSPFTDLSNVDFQLIGNLTQLAFGSIIFIVCSVLNIVSLRQLFFIKRKTSISKEIPFFWISFSIFLAQVLNLVVVMLFTIIPRPLSAHSLSARSSRIHQSIYVLCFRCFLGGTGVLHRPPPGPNQTSLCAQTEERRTEPHRIFRNVRCDRRLA
ncbi:hypothetical protein PRIPAC_74653 [Pristionchus pacificus]|uniref:Serpentine receptor class gamma n=1 Tax=Pristionchus pacificus TaxID=54126 RepID=A0A2A6C187_PRIPA|nr:hypothetical protein PRIPAC_74653 [Pristionchus pacificus]|eukprot:PDM71900.1 G protein-coupled receptor [Pristionchus pacificus]